MQSVYIETSIPSFYFETRTTAAAVVWRTATRRWWDLRRRQFRLVTSEAVVAELARAPAEKSVPGLEMLGGIDLLEPPQGIDQVVAFYIDNHLMPAEAAGDATHLAYASMHGIDILLTWNCHHLANA